MRILYIAMLAAAFHTCAAVTLKNDKVLFELDGNANLVSLKNLETGREYAGGGGLWRIIYQDGLSLEEELLSSDVKADVRKLSDDSLEISYGEPFPVKIRCELAGDEIRMTPELRNASKDFVLREFQFPYLKGLKFKKQSRLITTYGGGAQYRDIRTWIKGSFTAYKALDNESLERNDCLYPCPAASNFFVLGEPGCSLYFASYDPSFAKTLHLFRLVKPLSENPEVVFTMVKYPFLKAGLTEKLAPYVLSPHSGDWHVSAKKYSDWAHTWYRQAVPPKSITDSNGWQRVIMRHQYGKVFFKYSELPKIYKIGAKAGIDTIFMFGWWKEGMDNGYPDYTPDDTQGGDAALKREIAEVKSLGGNVIVYYNGQLIDVGTNFYKELGKKVSVKRVDGSEHFERYEFGGAGTALRVFGYRTFATACPSSPEWLGILEKLVDRSIDLGASGVFFDQLGYKSRICYDESHPHKVPSVDIMRYKREMLSKLRAYIKGKRPDMSFGFEWISDPTSQFADYIHACGFNMNVVGNDENGRPIMDSLPVTRYAFPELRTSDRNIRDESEFARRLNCAVLYGFFSDVEIYRCRATIAEMPRYEAYMTEIDALRDKYRRLILNGTFCDTDNASTSDKQVYYSTFTSGGELALVATQWHLKNLKCAFTVAGYEFVECAGTNGFKVSGKGENIEVELPQNALAIAIFKKK